MIRRFRLVIGTELRANLPLALLRRSLETTIATGIMVSFGELMRRPQALEASARQGLAGYLGVRTDVYLDNGSFSLVRERGTPPVREYIEYVQRARPDWFPVPADYVPLPTMSRRRIRLLAERTTQMNRVYGPRGFVPVVHVGPDFRQYFERVVQELDPPRLAVGGVVPHIRYGRGAAPQQVIETLAWARQRFPGAIHVFGLGGGIGSLYLAAALGIDSMDSSGWRIRAARGIVLMPGRGERVVVRLGGWGKRRPSPKESEMLARCRCWACRKAGPCRLLYRGRVGFEHRAFHNLSVLLVEARLIQRHLDAGDFREWAMHRLRENGFRRVVRAALDAAR